MTSFDTKYFDYAEDDIKSKPYKSSIWEMFGFVFTQLLMLGLLLLAGWNTFKVIRRSAYTLPSDGLFTPNVLSQYNGTRGRPILLAVMGSVYDVTKGHKHYAPGEGSYSFFAGKDGSRAYVTGKFDVDLHDDVSDFTPEQHYALLDWKKFYDNSKVYKFVGRVVGRFYDEAGTATPLLMMSQMKAELYEKNKESKLSDFPPCKVSWSKDQGGKVYCDEGRYPRRVLQDLSMSGDLKERCACLETSEVTDAVKMYDGCSAHSSSCKTSQPETST